MESVAFLLAPDVSGCVQCCAYSVGQAAQPILSVNYGSHNWERIRETLRYALYTVAFAVIILMIRYTSK